MRRSSIKTESPLPCFNPRPAVRPGDAIKCVIIDECHLVFQSAPGREAGRCARDMPVRCM